MICRSVCGSLCCVEGAVNFLIQLSKIAYSVISVDFTKLHKTARKKSFKKQCKNELTSVFSCSVVFMMGL